MPSRRDFLRVGAIGGAALCLEIPLLSCGPRAASRFAPNPWLRVFPDGRVTLVVARSEMGQGVRTSLAMILAEELDADWASVSIEQASPGPDYGNLNTGGSDSVASAWRPLRMAAAAAREMLLEAAARTWKVERSSCRRGERVGRPRRDAAGAFPTEASWRPRRVCRSRRSRRSRAAKTFGSSEPA